MLGPEVPLGPAASRLELDAEKVPDLAKYTVLHFADQFAVGIADLIAGTKGDGTVHLKTGARERDVLEIGYASACTAGRILPLDVHDIRAEHPEFNSPVHHNLYLLAKSA
jgi:hypothetical protein